MNRVLVVLALLALGGFVFLWPPGGLLLLGLALLLLVLIRSDNARREEVRRARPGSHA